MPYALQYTSSSGKWASYPQLDIASGENFTIEFTARVDVTGISRIVGGATSNTVSRIWMQQGGAPNFRITNAAGTSADWTFTISLGVYYKVRFVRIGSTIELFIDDASQGTRTLSGAFSFDRFFAHATTAGGGCTVQCVQTISSAGTRLYRNDSGTGSIWPDLNNSANNASQVGGWPTDDSEWVFYSSGATAYADTLLAGSYAHSGSLLNSSVGYSSALQAGSFTHSGSDLGSSVARSSVLLAGSYTHSGSALGSAVGYSSTLQSGAFSYSGSELQSIISNGAQNYSDTLLGGAFTHSGSALQSAIARNSTLLAGSYSHSGSSLSASLAFYSALNGGAYSHFGSMLQSTISGQVTVSIEGYTITFATDTVSGAFAADTVAATFINDYVSATWSN